MYEGIIKNIDLSLDINARKRVEGSISINLYSRDIETGVFEFTFVNEEESPMLLDDTYAAKIMIKFHNDENMFFVDDMEIAGNVARFVFPHSFIRVDGKVTIYIYLTKGNKTSDVAAITFDVNRSEIDKFSTEIYKVYDKNYEEVLAEFEETINLTRDEWSDMAEKTRNFVSVIEGKTVDEFVELKMGEKYNEIESNYITRLLKNEQDIVSTNTQLAEIVQDDSIVVTVGASGDYQTINEAISFLSKKTLKYDKSGFNAEILLKSGFVMEEQVFVKNLDLGFITISSEDAEVSIDASSFVQNINEAGYGNSGFPLTSGSAFTGYGNAILPTINVLFNFNGTGVSGRTCGVYLIYGAIGRIARKKGFKNGLATGATIVEGSRLYATESILSGHKGNNISCFRGSYVLFRAGIATGSIDGYGIYLDNACIGDLISGDFSDNKASGIWASGQSLVSANRMIANNCTNGIIADTSSIVDAHLSTINNSTQRGIHCDGSTINVNDSIITGSGTQSINVTNNSNVTAKNSDLTGARGTNAVYVYGGGSCNITNAKCQKDIGVDGSEIRVGKGGIIFAHDATGGFSGATPNTLSSNGIIFNSSTPPVVGFSGTTNSRVTWGTVNFGSVGSSTIPLPDSNKRTVTITRVNLVEGGDLTSTELGLLTMEKLHLGFSLYTNNSELAEKLSQTNTAVHFTVN